MPNYKTWLAQMETAILRLTKGLVSYFDLPDEVDVWDLWDSGYTPTQAAREVLDVAGFPLDD